MIISENDYWRYSDRSIEFKRKDLNDFLKEHKFEITYTLMKDDPAKEPYIETYNIVSCKDYNFALSYLTLDSLIETHEIKFIDPDDELQFKLMY